MPAKRSKLTNKQAADAKRLYDNLTLEASVQAESREVEAYYNRLQRESDALEAKARESASDNTSEQDPDAYRAIHLTFVGYAAGKLLCGKQRAPTDNCQHAMLAPVNNPEFRSKVCDSCLREYAGNAYDDGDEMPDWVSELRDQGVTVVFEVTKEINGQSPRIEQHETQEAANFAAEAHFRTYGMRATVKRRKVSPQLDWVNCRGE